MLQLRLATSGKVLGAAICREPGRVPESDRGLHTELILKCSQRRGSVVGPVTPSAASETILHAACVVSRKEQKGKSSKKARKQTSKQAVSQSVTQTLKPTQNNATHER